MVRLSLGSGKRRTSRFRKKGRRTGKYTTFAPKAALYNTITSKYYPPLPAKMHLSLRASKQLFFNIAPGNAYTFGASLVSHPWLSFALPADSFAGGFLVWMSFYSKAVVKKATYSVRAQAYGTTEAQNANFTADFITAVVPASQYDLINAGLVSVDKIKSMPDCHTKGMGNPAGGHDVVTDHRTIDVEKYLGQPLTSDQAIIKLGTTTTPNRLTVPSPEQRAPLPMHMIAFILPDENPDGVNTRFATNVDVRYDVEFSDMRDLPTNAAQAAILWSVNTRA